MLGGEVWELGGKLWMCSDIKLGHSLFTTNRKAMCVEPDTAVLMYSSSLGRLGLECLGRRPMHRQPHDFL